MKKPILTKYLKDSIYMVEESRVREFDNLFETMIMLLGLKHNLTVDCETHGDFDLTLYARNKSGISDFSFKLDTTLYAEDNELNKVLLEFQIKIVIDEADIDLASIEEFDLNAFLDIYTMTSKYNEDLLFDVLMKIIHNI
jgi:hypothetical protein